MARAAFRGYNRIKFQSLKLNKTVFCQSLILRDYLTHLEWDDSVISYQIKPFQIIYKINNAPRKFQPHLLVERQENQPSIVWLKSTLNNDEKDEKFIRLITDVCNQNNYILEVKTPCEIRKEPYFSNLKLLRRYNRCEISVQEIFLCSDFFGKFSNPVFGDLVEFFQFRENFPQTAFALLSQKIIRADFDSSLINEDLPIQLINPFPNFKNGRIDV